MEAMTSTAPSALTALVGTSTDDYAPTASTAIPPTVVCNNFRHTST
jgi:hypothetical protein